MSRVRRSGTWFAPGDALLEDPNEDIGPSGTESRTGKKRTKRSTAIISKPKAMRGWKPLKLGEGPNKMGVHHPSAVILCRNAGMYLVQPTVVKRLNYWHQRQRRVSAGGIFSKINKQDNNGTTLSVPSRITLIDFEGII